MRPLPAFLLIVLSAATACDASRSVPPSVLIGTWGGDHAGLVATAGGGTLEYDCATGRITEPLRPGADGRFVAAGTHSPGHGGPALIDEVVAQRPAHFSGRVDDSRLELTVVMTDSNVVVGTFQLTRGRTPRVLKCL